MRRRGLVMDKRRREVYRRKLERVDDDLRTLVSRTAQEGRNTDVNSPDDAAERAANSYTKEFLFYQSDSKRVQIQMVRRALERTKSKEFGLCESCGQTIEKKRLDAVPWTSFCRACQEEEENQSEPAPATGL